MNEIQKQSTEGEELEPRKTGNLQLDRLLNETAAIPLAISSAEMIHLLPKVSGSFMSRLGNFKWIITGAIILAGVAIYMIFLQQPQVLVKEKVQVNPPVESKVVTENTSVEKSESSVNKIQDKTMTQKLSVKEKTVEANKNSIYLEGYKTVLLNDDGKNIAVELNATGVKKITDNGVEVATEKYDDYNAEIQKAYARSGITYQPETKSKLSAKEELAEAIIQGLYKEKLLEEGQSYDLLITPEEAILNQTKLSDENHLKMLQIIEHTSGKTLPPGGKIHIRH